MHRTATVPRSFNARSTSRDSASFSCGIARTFVLSIAFCVVIFLAFNAVQNLAYLAVLLLAYFVESFLAYCDMKIDLTNLTGSHGHCTLSSEVI
jgi:hypothetical protein